MPPVGRELRAFSRKTRHGRPRASVSAQQGSVAWLEYLERLGLNGCLADDMGLGKTMQVLALLVHERENHDAVGPTLLVAPTSVVGNWEKEAQRYTPHLSTWVHHGA